MPIAPASGGEPAAAQWWVVNAITRPGGPRGPQSTNYVIVSATTRPANAVAGPFATKADATAWQTSANTAGNSPGSAAGGAGDAVANATGLTSITQGLAKIGAFFEALTHGDTWRSVGWLLLGAIMIIAGLVLWLKKQDLLPKLPNVLPVPV